MTTAVLVDGGFFIKRYRSLIDINHEHSPKLVAKNLHDMCLKHLSSRHYHNRKDLYRIFYYDCPPIIKKVHHPISNNAIDFSKTNECLFRQALHSELKQLRKVALRLGRLADNGTWQLKPHKVKDVLRERTPVSELQENDVYYNIRQKGVDMRIGLDIASITYKKQADQIVLVAGDSDFVPAAKLARREGIDFILDPMWNPINPDLHEHIDGLRSTFPSINRKAVHEINHVD